MTLRKMLGACRALAATLYHLGDFETARQYATRAVQIWHSEQIRSAVEEVMAPIVVCLCMETLSEWHLAEISFCHATMAKAISLAKELNDLQASATALFFAAFLAHFEGNPTEVERLAAALIELSTRQNFATWPPGCKVLRGWARSASGSTTERFNCVGALGQGREGTEIEPFHTRFCQWRGSRLL